MRCANDVRGKCLERNLLGSEHQRLGDEVKNKIGRSVAKGFSDGFRVPDVADFMTGHPRELELIEERGGC